MAAIIMALRRARNKIGVNDADKDGLGSAASKDDLDTNHDGRISKMEMKQALDSVCIRCDVFAARLRLERDLGVMLIKMPNFCVCMICFLVALMEFSPAADVGNVHRHLRAVYELDSRAKTVNSLEGIYAYLEIFERHNEELQATSAKYWCEHRYARHRWDDHYLVPTWDCPSPRLQSLGLLYPSQPSASWTSQCGTARPGSCRRLEASNATQPAWDSRIGTDEIEPQERKLAGGSSSTGGSSGSCGAHCYGGPLDHTPGVEGHRLRPNPSCEDDDAGLAIEENIPGYTCAGHKDHICGLDLGLYYCRLTCGYCAPFIYDHLKPFEKPQVTMMPVMIHQTRFPKVACHGFAHAYEHQPYNPNLYLLPTLDGVRTAPVLTCIDRNSRYQEPYAHVIHCPTGSPINRCYCANSTSHEGRDTEQCTDRYMYHTKKQEYHHEPIYPMLLVEPHRDVEAMKKISWLDLQTDTVVLSTLVYTEGIEIFTSLSIFYSIDNAGNIVPTIKLISYRDLLNGAKASFIACIVICICGALLGVVASVWQMVKNPEECQWGYAAYELVSRAILFAYPLVLIVSWSMQTPMAEEYDHLLHSFLDIPSMSHHDVDVALEKYFEVKTHIYEETTWLMRHRIAAYIVCYIQFVQLIFYMNAHPKMAVLTATLWRAFDNMLHFLMLFSILFLMLAYMAHWMLGGDIDIFSTFGGTISAQGRMIYGEFIYASGAEDLNGIMMVMYWFYAFTFMLVMFFTLLNFFLAIVVDAFADVKEGFESQVVLSNFIVDICSTMHSRALGIKEGWPTHGRLINFLETFGTDDAHSKSWVTMLASEDGEDDGGGKVRACPMEAFSEAFPEPFRDQDALAGFIRHYFMTSSQVLVRKAH